MFGKKQSSKREAAEYLREWIENNMPLRVDASLPTDVLSSLDILGVPLRASSYWTHRGYPQSELERLARSGMREVVTQEEWSALVDKVARMTPSQRREFVAYKAG